jgi:Na+/proline symporter
MNDATRKKINRFLDRALVTVFAVISIFLLAVMVFSLVKSPLPLNAAGLSGWMGIIFGFIFLGGLFWPHLEGKVIDDKKNSAHISGKTKPGWKGIPLWKRIAIVIAATVDVLAILFVLGYIIRGLIETL